MEEKIVLRPKLNIALTIAFTFITAFVGFLLWFGMRSWYLYIILIGEVAILLQGRQALILENGTIKIRGFPPLKLDEVEDIQIEIHPPGVLVLITQIFLSLNNKGGNPPYYNIAYLKKDDLKTLGQWLSANPKIKDTPQVQDLLQGLLKPSVPGYTRRD